MLIVLIILCLGCCIGSVPLSDLFPYGPSADDSSMGLFNDSADPLHLPYQFPYFDNLHSQIWIMNNGLFSFSEPTDHFFSPQPFSSFNGSSFVAGYWHTRYEGVTNDTRGKVYYQVHSNTSSSNATMKVFDKANEYVRNFFPEQRFFKAKMVIIGTWYYISIDSDNNGTDVTLNNTFQIVLCTDEDRSFVFLLYHDLQWFDFYNSSYPHVGFATENRNNSHMLPYSGTEDIFKLVNESNVNVPGLFAFRVDANQINAGGCDENTSMMSFRPRIGSQLGSTPLEIYGPCFTGQTKIRCQFGSLPGFVRGIVIDKDRAICLTPLASTHGSVTVNISIDDGQTYIPTGHFTYAPLQFGSDQVTINTETNENLLAIGQNIILTWRFSQIVTKTFPNNTRIDIELWNVIFNNQSQLQNTQDFVTLGQNLGLIDSLRVSLPSNISYISTCFIRVKAHLNSQTYAALNTGLLVIQSHPSIASQLCQKWADQQPQPATWNSDGLLQCPMTRQQAIAAGRCCYQSDPQCYLGSANPHNCWLHRARSGRDEPSAVECYTSIAANRYEAAVECCYDNATMLITRGTGAGTDDRYGRIISPVKHFFHDTLPYLQCCIMSTSAETCNTYLRYRPVRRGSNTMGETGRMWGDPHFGTLDGMSYTFNGYGEYTYLAIIISSSTSPSPVFNINNQSYVFMSQIRTTPLSSDDATITKGFAARSNDGEAISVTVSDGRSQHLILRRGNESLEFEENINTLFFPELTITRLDDDNNSHFSLSWTIGVTIEINAIKLTSPSEQLVLNIGASVSGIFRERTYGLLGTYDGRSDNDLRNKNGTIIRNNASLEEIHKDFGMTWSIDPSTSLFYYESDQTAAFFSEKNHEFIPSFSDPTTKDNSTIRNICKIDVASLPSSWNIAERACYYDLSVTNDVNFAQVSLETGNELLERRKNQINPPLFDSSLPTSITVKHGDLVSLNISATSEDPLHTVRLSLIHQPKNSTFIESSRVFKWVAVKGEDYLSIRAVDLNTNLTSKHDIVFNVSGVDNPLPKPDNGMSNPFDRISYSIIIVGIILLFGQ